MATRICAADDCNNPDGPVYEPVLPEQMFCSDRCANRVRQQRWRERHKANPNGGGPGGKRQPMLFQRSEMHRRKPAKAAIIAKPKQDALFPEEASGRDLLVSFGGALECAGDGAVSDNGHEDFSKYSVKSAKLPPQNQAIARSAEAPVAA